MKKLITGAIAGALLLTSVSVFADSASLVGKKVQGLFTVEQNGTKIAEAVIIDGVAYAPVRAVSQAAGVQLTVEGKKIIMNEAIEPTPTPAATSVTNRPTISEEQAKENKIVSLTGKLATLSGKIAMAEAQLKDKPDNAELQQKVIDLKAEYATLEAQLAELQK
ncbi:hypothetical protein NST28_29040 [Paenibacillus sp. FSL R10-2791]|uniref:hypothetical protein n=1 Tax=Paenibacillus TaxID=44249 RepID=UPI00096CBAA6|nr:hypothetical protein [Paenibacillus odorifer]OME12782.1 hypothetical protein BSK60_16905 [Paenibacillus odorifer]